ncbi:ventral anterior homeobox 2-like [Daphnia carinata]|uniref:ventral anterior homeobox 2-like n=1 Tax=Daphnia carinata TaxID=120202 RepID=UPI00257C8DE3|nr:ventral anterior homeobox 2-like [Daphnia carinata]
MDTYGCGRRPMDHHRGRDATLPDYVQTVVVKDSKGLEKILLLPKALDLDRPKRSRTAFAKWQLDALETTFGSHPYLVGEQRTLLARRLGLSETQIKVWYQNRRTKQRKEGHPSVSGSDDQPTNKNPSKEEPIQLHPPSSSSVIQETSGSPPETQWQRHHPADFFGQAFQHYHPAMYQQLMQSYSSHGTNGLMNSGAIPTPGSHSNSGPSAPPASMSTDRGHHHHIHRVY